MLLYFVLFVLIWMVPNWWIHKVVFSEDPRDGMYYGYGPEDAEPDLLGRCLKVLCSMVLFCLFMRELAPGSMFSALSAFLI